MYSSYFPFENLDDMAKRALLEAESAMEKAWSPYSRFKVGAALFNNNSGVVVSGANFESASYGLTICAERSAVVRANARGMRNFQGIAVIARHEDFNTQEPTFPCGACRQILVEIAQISEFNIRVIVSTTKKDKILIAGVNELLLSPFGPVDVGINLSKYRK